MQYTDITNANKTNFGAIYRVDDTNFLRLHFMTYDSSTFIVYYSGTYLTLNDQDTNRHTFDLNIKNRTIKQDSNDPKTLSGGYVNTTLNFWLFARNSNDPELRYKNSSKLYSAKFYYDDVLVRDFVPMMRNSDNEVGLFDKLNHKFYENIGTSNFTSNLDE